MAVFLNLRVDLFQQVFLLSAGQHRIMNADRFSQVQSGILCEKCFLCRTGRDEKQHRRDQADRQANQATEFHILTLRELLFYILLDSGASQAAFRRGLPAFTGTLPPLYNKRIRPVKTCILSPPEPYRKRMRPI